MKKTQANKWNEFGYLNIVSSFAIRDFCFLYTLRVLRESLGAFEGLSNTMIIISEIMINTAGMDTRRSSAAGIAVRCILVWKTRISIM